MKVVHISRKDRGGAANGCIGLHQGLLAQGIESSLLVLEKTRDDIEACHTLYNSPASLFLGKAKNKLWGRKSYRKSGLPVGYENFTFPFSSHRPEQHDVVQSADIVNLHWIAEFINYPTFFKNVSQPIFWTLHDMNPFSGGYHFAEGFPMAAYSRHCESNTRLKNQALSGRNISVVSPSHWLANESASSEPFGEFAHHVIPYGVDIDTFNPADTRAVRESLGIRTEKKVLLFAVGSMKNKRKGLDYLLKALRNPELEGNFTLVVAGTMSDNIDLPADTIVLGQVAGREAMARVYSAADLFVTPAIEDNLPNTVLESLCCGTPVVAFNIGGMPDMIADNINGLLCPEVSDQALANTVSRALKTDFDRQKISHSARTRYSPDIQAREYIRLYQQQLNLC